MSVAIIPNSGVLLGRVKLSNYDYPRIVTVRDNKLIDITNKTAPTVRDICEMDNPAEYVSNVKGVEICSVEDLLQANVIPKPVTAKAELLSPIDLQAVKASGVTFVVSLLERVIEEQAMGDNRRADELRTEILGLIGTDLSKLVPGSKNAMELKEALIKKGVWSQYLEVGIGPDPEVFTKGQPMSTVGHAADVGLHPSSSWNNPEPEIALVIASTGKIVGATLGNDVNLRDVEGRSALLLGKAKDNNASASLGPLIRLFDADFDINNVKNAEIKLTVEGKDGFLLEGASSMNQISRTPESLVESTIGKHHQYPDGLVLYLGTMFAPVQDRGGEGKGFTHKIDDVVSISNADLGMLQNRVKLSTECDPWTYSASQLMRDLSKADLL